MKKLFVLLSLFLCVMAQAQQKPVQFGFTGGVNIGWFAFPYSDTYANDGVKPGGSWGLVADVFIMEGYSFTSGFNVLYINGATTLKTDTGSLNSDIRAQYIQLPLLFTMKTKPIKDKFRIFGQIGYGLGFLIRAKAIRQFTSEDGMVGPEKTINAYDEFTFTRSSLILAAGTEVVLHGSTYLRVGFKFDNSFVNMLKEDDLTARNRMIEFNVAVIF